MLPLERLSFQDTSQWTSMSFHEQQPSRSFLILVGVQSTTHFFQNHLSEQFKMFQSPARYQCHTNPMLNFDFKEYGNQHPYKIFKIRNSSL